MCSNKQPNYFQKNSKRIPTMDLPVTGGQEAIQVPDGYVAAKSMGDMDMTDRNEKDAEMLLMEEISNTIPEEDTQNGEPEMLYMDVDTTMDTTIDEEDDALDSKDHEHQVRKRGMLLIDRSGDEILLTEEARVVEPTGNGHSQLQERVERDG